MTIRGSGSPRLEAERRLEDVPQSQLPSPVAPFAYPAQPEADKPSAETPNVVHPAPSPGGIARESPSKQAIAFLAIAALLVVAGLIYLATRPSRPPQPAPVATVTSSPPAIATPTVEEKASSTPPVTLKPSAQPTAPVAVAIHSPSIAARRPRKKWRAGPWTMLQRSNLGSIP